MRYIAALTLLTSFAPATAGAQVLITEILTNPTGGNDTAEWVEIHNTSTVAVSLEGWTINDFTGTTPTGESSTRWTFPSTATIAAGQVWVVTRQAMDFMGLNGMPPTWELADGMDDAMVPNLTPVGGMSSIQLVNGANGDAVILRDSTGTFVDGIEYGTVDRSVPGIPQTQVPAENGSLYRVATTNSSNSDFRVTTMPTPFVGYTAAPGPAITEPTSTPSHLRYGGPIAIATAISDPAGIASADIYLATATATSGDSVQDYVTVAMTSTSANRYTFEATTNNIAPGVAPSEPMTFHDLFIRYFIAAENNMGQSSTEPDGAEETQDNAAFHQRNVMPRAPSPISDARTQNAVGRAIWTGLSVTVRGTALVKSGILTPNRLDIALEDSSGYALRVFNNEPGMIEVAEGDLIEAVGTISQFHGTFQLAGDSSIEKIGTGGTVTATVVTIAELLADAEHWEGKLVRINDADFVTQPDNFPSMGTGGNVMIKDPTGELNLRITSATDLFGMPAPRYGFDIQGIVGQFHPDLAGTTDNYQILARGVQDLFANPPPPDAGIWPDASESGRDATTGGRDGGTGGTDATGGTGGEADSGCGCSTSSGAGGGFALAMMVALVFGLAILRRRR